MNIFDSIRSCSRAVAASSLAAASLVSFSGVAPAQAEPAEPAPKQQVEAKVDVLDLIEQLGADGFRERREAERQLRALGDDATSALRAAADEHEDPEVRWRARKLVGETQGGDGQLKPRSPGRGLTEAEPTEPRADDEPFDRRVAELLERLEATLEHNGIRGRVDLRPLRDMREQMDQLDRELDELRNQNGFRILGNGLSQGMTQKVEIGPDGVRVETRQKGENGEEETKVYEAEDMESFREKYPEVAERFHIGGNGSPFRVWGGNGATPFGSPRIRFFRNPGAQGWPGGPWTVDPRATEPQRLQPLAPRLQDPRLQDPRLQDSRVDDWNLTDSAPSEGRRLGVYVGDLKPGVREYFELDEGVGLLVDRVADEGLAHAMGILAKDIVLSINGEVIHGAADVARVLGGIAKGDKVEVEVLRKGERKSLSTAKQHDAEKNELRQRQKVR